MTSNILCTVIVTLWTNVQESPIYAPPLPNVGSTGRGAVHTVGKREVTTVIREIVWQGGGYGPTTNSEVISITTVTFGYVATGTNHNVEP